MDPTARPAVVIDNGTGYVSASVLRTYSSSLSTPGVVHIHPGHFLLSKEILGTEVVGPVRV